MLSGMTIANSGMAWNIMPVMVTTVTLLSVILVLVLSLLVIVISIIIIAAGGTYDLRHLLLRSPWGNDGGHCVPIGRVLPGAGIARCTIDSTLLLILVRCLPIVWWQVLVWLLAIGRLVVAIIAIKRGRARVVATLVAIGLCTTL